MRMDEQRYAIVLGFGKVGQLYCSWDEQAFSLGLESALESLMRPLF